MRPWISIVSGRKLRKLELSLSPADEPFQAQQESHEAKEGPGGPEVDSLAPNLGTWAPIHRPKFLHQGFKSLGITGRIKRPTRLGSQPQQTPAVGTNLGHLDGVGGHHEVFFGAENRRIPFAHQTDPIITRRLGRHVHLVQPWVRRYGVQAEGPDPSGIRSNGADLK